MPRDAWVALMDAAYAGWESQRGYVDGHDDGALAADYIEQVALCGCLIDYDEYVKEVRRREDY